MSYPAASRLKTVGLPLLMALVLSFGLAAALQLQNVNQDIRQQASVDDENGATDSADLTASPTPSPDVSPDVTPSPPPPASAFKLYWQFCQTPACTPANVLDPVQRQLIFSSEETANQTPTVYVGRSFGFPVVEFPGPVEIINQYPPTVSYINAIENSSSSASLQYAQFDLRGQGFLDMAGENYSFATPAATLTKIDEKMIALPQNTDTPAWFKGYYYQIVLQDLPNAVPYQFGSPSISQGIVTIFKAEADPAYPIYKFQASDLNNDGKINLFDFSYLRSELLKSKTYFDADLNTDGRVDLLDFSLFVQHFRQYLYLVTT